MLKKKDLSLKCFSPPVMLATIVIELGLALYTVWRYKMSSTVRLFVVIFTTLAIFQLAEYMVCEKPPIIGLNWSKVGFVAITALPPLGLHLIFKVAKFTSKSLLTFAYGSAIVFAGYFAFANQAFSGNQCLGNYVIFQLDQTASFLYLIYYYGWLAVGIASGLWLANKTKNKRQRMALWGVVIGYSVFLVPTSVLNLLDKATIDGIPSIMCGFAVLMALIFGFFVLPLVSSKKLR